MPDKTDLSIIIVTWNSDKEIENCLNSIIDNTNELNYEIVIVDNNSSDKTLEVIRNVTDEKIFPIEVIANNNNAGFTKACNQGILSSSGSKILFLNPDTMVIGDSLKVMSDKLESNNKIGAVAPQLLNEDGSIQKSCRTFPDYFDMFSEFSLLTYIFPNSIIFSNWKMNYFNHNEERMVEQPMAAALMIGRKVLEKVNNFDERFIMFFNDVDICRKIYANGDVIDFYPESKVIHSKGVSIYKDRERMIKIWNKDCLSYFKKYHYNFFLYNWLLISLKISGYLRILFYRIKK